MVSVIIPMYNSEQTIVRTLESVRKQTYKGEIEVIIVNDGSRDRSLEVVKEYLGKNTFPHVRIIDKENGGVSTARNMGMRAAKGEYIALLDSDDEWEDNKLHEQMSILENSPNVELLGCNRNREVFTRFLFKKFMRVTSISSRLLLYKNFFPTPTVVFRRRILDTVGYFDESQRYAEEGNYWIRICKEGNCMLLNESYVSTGAGKPDFGFSGLSSNLKEMEKGELKNLRDALNLKIINIFEYAFLYMYSIIKYLRRVLIVKFR